MNSTNTDFQSDVLSTIELRRYALQIGMKDFGILGQEKIKSAKVLVIGAGGKGTSALENLVSLGVGKIGICDNYPVQENELSRQHLYGSGDLGKQKAIIARQKLQEINHLVNFQLHNVCLTKENILPISEPYDILIDATDNYPAHILINDAAVKMGKPVIYGSVSGNVGLVSIFNFKEGPSFRCAYPDLEAFSKSPSSEGFSCQLALLSIIGAVMANEAIKVILDLGNSISGNMLSVDTSRYSFTLEKISKDPKNFM